LTAFSTRGSPATARHSCSAVHLEVAAPGPMVAGDPGGERVNSPRRGRRVEWSCSAAAWLEGWSSTTAWVISEEDRVRVFDRFYRSRTLMQPLHAGDAPGLYIAREIVSAHGGSIAARRATAEAVYSASAARDDQSTSRASLSRRLSCFPIKNPAMRVLIVMRLQRLTEGAAGDIYQSSEDTSGLCWCLAAAC